MTVHPIPGKLSDHYDPRDRSIRLSEPVYDVQSVAAMAIAAHETGHAIQHREGYGPLTLRTALGPLVALGARFGIPAALVGLLLGSPFLIQFGVIGYVGALAFQLLSLPLEFDASRRALSGLDRLGVLNAEEQEGARSVLRSAAMTYVASTASAAAYIVYQAMLAGRWLLGRPSSPLPARLP
jgi:Zn-dependent membrane protease YugP